VENSSHLYGRGASESGSLAGNVELPMRTFRGAMRFLLGFTVVRFVIDFWESPPAAVRRYARRRSWPSKQERAAMGPAQFSDYVRSLDPTVGGPEYVDAVHAYRVANLPGSEGEPIAGESTRSSAG